MNPTKPSPALADITLRTTLRAGDIGFVTYLHGVLYDREYAYGPRFEGYVAAGLNEFVQQYDSMHDRMWLAEIDDEIVGSIAIMRRDRDLAQLRWYLVHPSCRTLGLGRRLMNAAMGFCTNHPYRRVYLWTVSELTVAAHIYRAVGFQRTERQTHETWGKVLTEERYDLVLPLE